MKQFQSCGAWFAKSVPRTHIDIWLAEGGAQVASTSDSAMYLFSNNASDHETAALLASSKVVYRSAWILDCHLSGARKPVGPYILTATPTTRALGHRAYALTTPSPSLSASASLSFPPPPLPSFAADMTPLNRPINTHFATGATTTPREPPSAHKSWSPNEMATPQFRPVRDSHRRLRSPSDSSTPHSFPSTGSQFPALTSATSPQPSLMSSYAGRHKSSLTDLVRAYSPHTSTRPRRSLMCHTNHSPFSLGATTAASDATSQRLRRLSTQSLSILETPSRSYHDPFEMNRADTMSETQSVVSHMSYNSQASSLASVCLDSQHLVARYILDTTDNSVVQDLLGSVHDFVPNQAGFTVKRNLASSFLRLPALR
ncbi:hypothetical protein H4R34_005277 [Dimargaris verticillata]|uniref:BRCT domain-containing protein n=1 Tax=Dimargaris verticillata TaxID=2761393 RepID=A0A9W8B2K5_9FUNG|nr:hypothetical protein H4R34_005277 [Dimargaris verticillata]